MHKEAYMAGIADDLNNIKSIVGGLSGNNKVSRFAYTQAAYNNNDAAGRSSFDINADNNIPTNDANTLDTNPTVIDRGFQTQASSITRQLQNHFYGRVSYNLNKIVDKVYDALGTLSAAMGRSDSAAGDKTYIATLDANGRLPSNQLTEDAMEIRTYWDASTNTPDLTAAANKRPGNVYYVSTEGTRDIGGGSKTYYVGDVLICNKSYQWERIPVTYVKGGAENASAYRTGKADITKANVGLGNVADIDQSPGLKDITFTAAASSVTVGATRLDNTAATLTGSSFPMASSTQAGLMSKDDYNLLHDMVLDFMFPVGSLYWTSDSSFNPNVTFGGAWVRIKDTFIWAAGDNDTVVPSVYTKEDGELTVTIGVNNLPAHTHALGGNTGSTKPSFTNTVYETSDPSPVLKGSIQLRKYYNGNNPGWAHNESGSTMMSETDASGSLGQFDSTSTEKGSRYFNINATHKHTINVKTDGSVASHTHTLPADTGNNTTTATALSIQNPRLKRFCWERTS